MSGRPHRRVVIVSRSMPPDVGGYQRQFSRLMPWLAERTDVTWIGAVRDSHEVIDRADYRSVALPAARIPRSVRGCVDLMVVALSCVTILSLGVRGRRGVLVLLSPTMVMAPMVARVAKLVDWSVIVRYPSQGDQSHARGRRLGTSAGVVSVVPSPGQVGEQTRFGVVPVVNAVEVRDTARAFDRDSGTFIYVGRLVASKRPELILDSWARIADRLPGWQLMFVGGGGSDRESVEQKLRSTVRRERVPRCEVVGAVDDPQVHLDDADVFVFPSLREGMPNSMLEALASGLPAIADPTLAEGWFGRPVPLLAWDGEAGTLAAAMLQAATDPQKRQTVSAAAKKFVSDHHEPAVIVGRLLDLAGIQDADRVGCR